ncbi:NINE protein [Crocosphaera sp. UHCC 0190]|uniref:NINE protein n=1 Tax=Crocosphaera sp. UHCC 0190 TaxID=3110246 RepID=UPI002B20E79A|nr:NINE protein [Crocosphaera sp. UHCC 0190]MEA5508501.1 NINE protein [Crocosphaera sp. UHCC 0190]
MSPLEKLFSQPKNRKMGIILALLSTIIPWPIAGIHKFYLGQPVWGVIYFLLWNTPIPSIACAIDAVWYFVQGEEQFNAQFNGLSSNHAQQSYLNSSKLEPIQVGVISEALRELDKLREDGLVSDYEFEQKRRQLLDRIS